jgi:class 3 adenylate cyclase
LALKEDLQETLAKIFKYRWSQRDGDVVPEPEDLRLANDAVNLEAVVLYADMAESTQLVDGYKPFFAAEVYKAYMACAARIVKENAGAITAYDGDRIMGVFIGASKNSTAAKTALQINWSVSRLINPAIREQYGQDAHQMKHVVGVDTSKIFACRIGVRNDNDIVWVGPAANYAAKLSSINGNYPVYITGTVFDRLNDASKFGGTPPKIMWEERVWTEMEDMRIYGSNWVWGL